MKISFRVRYFARKSMLTLFGPAQLDEHRDPIRLLEYERELLLGPRPVKEQHVHIPKRRFAHAHELAA